MTAEQNRLYRGMLRLFRAFQTGPSLWGTATASGSGPGARTVTQGGAVTMRVLEASLVRARATLPLTGIYAADWWGLGDAGIVADTIIYGAGLAFLVDGQPDTSQGFSVYPLKKTAFTPIHPPAAMRAGLRIGAH